MEDGLILLALCTLLARLGLGLYLTGTSRSRNAAAAVMRTLADFCVALLAFWAVGYAILSARLLAIAGWDRSFAAAGFFYASMILLATGAALGGTLERAKFGSIPVISALLAAFVVPLSLYCAWFGPLASLGFIDVAGASSIHLVGGITALIGAIAAGPRSGKYNQDGSTNMIPGHSLPLAAAGAMTLLIGTLAQIAGCAWIRQANIGLAAADALLAAAAGGLAAMIWSRYRYGIIEIHLTIVGFLAGLVSASAGAGYLSTAAAVIIGAIAGVLAVSVAVWLDLKRKIDDPASAFSIHAVAGFWGLLAAGLVLHGIRQLLIQLLGACAIGALALAVSAAAFLVLRAADFLRLNTADELDGADLVEHDLNAYPDFQQTMIKSYHLRER